MNGNTAARVTVMRGTGDEQIAQAIEQGVVKGAFKENYESALAESKRLKFQLEESRKEHQASERALNEMRSVYREAMKAKRREEKRAERFKSLKIAMVAFVLLFAAVFVSTLLTTLIIK